MNGLGAQLRSLRKAADMTQTDVGEKIGVSQAAVGAWENGKSIPKYGTIVELAELFGVKPSDLVDLKITPSSKAIPIIGYTHMGDYADEGNGEKIGSVQIPQDVADAHPSCFAVKADGDCMDNRYPSDSILVIDPDMQPFNGCAVLAETENFESIVRMYSRGSSVLMLSPDSHTSEYEDIIVKADDAPVTLKGVVVWYQAEKDVRG